MQGLTGAVFHCDAMPSTCCVSQWCNVQQTVSRWCNKCPTGALCWLRLLAASNHTRWVVRVHYWDTHRHFWVIFVCLSLYLLVCLPRCLFVCKFVHLSNGLYFRQSVRTFPCCVGLLCCIYTRKLYWRNYHTRNWPRRQQKLERNIKISTELMTKHVYRYVYVVFGVVFVEVLLVFVVVAVVLCICFLFLYLSLPKQENSDMKRTEKEKEKKEKKRQSQSLL